MKKKFLITGMFLICFCYGFAQTQKNDFKAGINVHFTHDEQTFGPAFIFGNYKSINSGFNLTPTLGFFISDHLELGVGVGVGTSESNYNINDSIKISSRNNGFNTSIFGNKYFPIGEKVSFFLSASMNLSFSSHHYGYTYPGNDFQSDTKGFDYSFGLSPGISITPVKQILLSASYGNLGFSKEVDKDKETGEITQTLSRYGLQLDTSTIWIGISYIF